MRQTVVKALSALACMLMLSGCAHLLLDWPANDVPAASSASSNPDAVRPDLRQSFESLPGSGIEHAELRLLEDNTGAWTARWRLLADARDTIDVGYFILSQDVFGMAFLGHLLKKADDGVKIRILLDAQGRLMSQTSLGIDCLPALAHAENVSIRIYRPMPRRIVEALLTLNPIVAAASNHNKVIIVDRRTGLLGGRNIGDKYFAHPEDLATAFHDMDISLDSAETGAVLTEAFEELYRSDQAQPVGRGANEHAARCMHEMQRAYEVMDDWLRGAGPHGPNTADRSAWRREIERFTHLRGALRRTAVPALKGEVRVVNSLPRLGSSDDPVSQSLFRLLRGTAREALVENPYLVLTEEAASVLQEAGLRGVRITILTNSPVSSDNALSQTFFREQWPSLLVQVPGLRIYAGGTKHNLHGKFAVFDDQAALVGTYNLDPLSMAINGEIAVVVWSEAFARRLAARPRQMLRWGPPEVYQYRIRRDAWGRPERDRFGNVFIAFGPEDHSDPAEWDRPGCFWQLVRFSAWLPMTPPLFHSAH